MPFVWVRTVLRPDDQLICDPRAIEVRGEKPKDVELPLAERLDQALVHRGAIAGLGCRQETSNVRGRDATPGRGRQHRRHRCPFRHERSDVAFRLGQVQRTGKGLECGRAGGAVLASQGLQDEDLDDAPPPSSRFGRDQQSLEKRARLLDRTPVMGPGPLGQEHPGEGDVLELAHVGEVVIDRQSAVADPGSGLAQTALRGMDPRRLRRDGPEDGVVLAHEDTLGVLQQGEGAVGISSGQAELCHGDARSIGVLGQATLVPEVVALPKMIGRGIEVVPLEVQLAHPHVQVARSAQRGRPVVGRHPQALFVRPQRLVQTTLGDADLGQRSVAADRIDGVARAQQAGHGLGPEAMGGLEITASPVRQGKEPRRAAAPERIVLAGEVEGPQGERLRTLSVALELCLGGSIQGDRTGQPPELGLVHDDHRRGRGRLFLTGIGRRFQPSLGSPQQHLDVRELAMRHERSDIPHAQDRPNHEQVVGKQLEPAPHRRFLARLSEAGDRQLDHRPRLARSPHPRVRGESPPTAHRAARTTCSRADGGHGRGPAPRAPGAPAGHPRTGGGIGTTRGARRAGSRTDSVDRGPRASPDRHPVP